MKSASCEWPVQRTRVRIEWALWRGSAAAPRALVHAWSMALQVVERTGDSRWERRGAERTSRSVSATQAMSVVTLIRGWVLARHSAAELADKVRFLPLSRDKHSRLSRGLVGDVYPLAGGLRFVVDKAPGKPLDPWLRSSSRSPSRKKQELLASMTVTNGFVPIDPRDVPREFGEARMNQRSSWDGRDSSEVLELSAPLPCQDDFAKRTIVHQMVQGFARLAKGIDSLDDRLDFSPHDQRDDDPPCGGDRSG
jgi:hypothetical protein